MAPLMSEIAERFESKNGKVRVDIQTGGSSRGIADAMRGLADIGMSSRALYEKEKESLVTHTMALDAVAFVVHATNSIDSLSSQNVLDIFQGKIKNWKELGGQDLAVVVVNRAKGRSEYDLVTKSLGISPASIKADVIAGENQQCVKVVSNNPGAISYLSAGTAQFESENGTSIKLAKLDEVAPSLSNIRSGKYPIVRPLVLLVRESPQSQVNSFLKFALSSEVHDLVKGQSFVPLQ
jgi:phosphate transport system substrate-binding protein